MAIYLDNNATTPLDPRVGAAMRPWMGEQFGNPSSVHRFGQRARAAVEAAREKVAALLVARSPEIVFTASGTEANNTVLFSAASLAGFRGRIVMSAFEHPSIESSAARLEKVGMKVTRVRPRADGCVDAEEFIAALDRETRFASLMLANNEIGTLQPVAAVASECRRRAIPVHTDAVQAVGKIAVTLEELGVDYLTLGAHKFHGPLGAAALWVRGGAPLEPYLVGGGQERHRRAGTENVAAIVGLGRAAELAAEEIAARATHLARMRDHFESRVSELEGVVIHGASSPRLPNTSHLAFLGVDAQALLIRLDLAGFAVSTGSACASGTIEPSRTLSALGISLNEQGASLRVSLGTANTPTEIESFLEVLEREVAQLRRQPAAASDRSR